jgi:two-component system, chemotaxis family, chemotaxis protein CheY
MRAAVPRLLVIDDDNLHRMIICRAAAKVGYLPAGAASYEEAAGLVRDGAFDCITLDLSLGEHAGVEMLRHLWVIGCKAPIVVISGCDDATCDETIKVAESLKLNVWDTIPKPVDLAVLRASLNRLKASHVDEADAVAQPAQVSPA